MTFSCSIEELRAKVDDALEIDPARGVYRGRRDAFTDPDVFELEMSYIFEGNWIYLAHETQLPNNGDYLTVNMGRQPVVLTRDRNGELHALINACSHRVPCSAGARRTTGPPSPAPSTAGRSTTPASCSRSRTPRSGLPGDVQDGRLARPDEGPRGSSPTADSCSAA